MSNYFLSVYSLTFTALIYNFKQHNINICLQFSSDSTNFGTTLEFSDFNFFENLMKFFVWHGSQNTSFKYVCKIKTKIHGLRFELGSSTTKCNALNLT